MTSSLNYCIAVVGIALCSACATSAVTPSGAAFDLRYDGKTLSVNGVQVTAARALSPLPGFATIVPGAGARDYEYIGNVYGSFVGIFDYPTSDHLISKIPGGGGQLCTNVLYGYGKGTFWNIAGDTEIDEYAVPKKLIKSLSDSIGQPSSCAMNTSGDLAVGILNGSSSGDVIIFKSASGPGVVYSTPLSKEYFDGYDDKGNLFADGFSKKTGYFALVELPKGGKTFKKIATSNTVEFPGSVQWDGKYLTVFDQAGNSTYRYTVGGTRAALKSKVKFVGSSDCAQTWIVTGIIYCADAGTNGGEVFKYPAGGSAIAVLKGSFDLPLGVTAAQK